MKTLNSNLFATAIALIMTFGFFTNAIAGDASKKAKKMTIVEIAASDDRFSTLVEAVVKADLAGALSAEGPYTVFAPTNDAFDALFETIGVNGIDDLTKEQLTPILLYHVVSGKVMAADVSSGNVSTLNSDADMMVSVKDGKVWIDKDSNVIITDIEGSNGVIHVIDAVLVPADKTASTKKSGCN